MQRDAKFVKKTPRTPLNHQQQPDRRQDEAMISCCLHRILNPPCECCSTNRVSSDQATFFQSFIVKFWWSSMNFNLSFLLLADSGSALCGFLPAVADLLQGSICCAFRDALLHPLAVTSTYLCYCCLLLKQCTHSPQTSGINKGIFTQRTTARLIFSLFHTIVCKTQTLAGCAENPPVYHQLIWWLVWTFATMSTRLSALSCIWFAN